MISTIEMSNLNVYEMPFTCLLGISAAFCYAGHPTCFTCCEVGCFSQRHLKVIDNFQFPKFPKIFTSFLLN